MQRPTDMFTGSVEVLLGGRSLGEAHASFTRWSDVPQPPTPTTRSDGSSGERPWSGRLSGVGLGGAVGRDDVVVRLPNGRQGVVLVIDGDGVVKGAGRCPLDDEPDTPL